jgi:hypothetical protein
MRRLLSILTLAAVFSGCVVAPPYGYDDPAYGPAPGPRVGVGVGVGTGSFGSGGGVGIGVGF